MLLVEGVAGVGKTTLINLLIRKYIEGSNRIRSLLNLTQAHTYFPLSPDATDRKSTVKQNLAHLEQILSLLTWLTSSVSYETRKIFISTIDTLHITHCFRPGVVTWNDVTNFDRQASSLGCKLIFLKASKEVIWERTVWSRRDNEFITHYGKKYGSSLEGIHDYFVQEQEGMLSVVKQSNMEKLILDCDRPATDIAQDVFDYWIN